MKARQAKKIVRIVDYTPINKISDRWYDKAFDFYNADGKTDERISWAKKRYTKGVEQDKVKPMSMKRYERK